MRLSDVRLDDPDLFLRSVPHEMFRVLRREAPVHFHEEKDGPGFWVVSRYADVKHVSKRTDLFSSERRGTMLTDPGPEDLPLPVRVRVVQEQVEAAAPQRLREVPAVVGG